MDADEKVDFDFENTFNPEEYLYFYQDFLSEDRLKKEIDFLIKYTELNHPVKILALACGHGRHANTLAKMGHHVTGIDCMQGFLKIAQENAKHMNVNVNYIHQDMRNIDYSKAFDRIVVLFTAIGYFDDAQNEQVFKSIFNALKPNGIFCFDLYNRDVYQAHYLPTSFVEKEGNSMRDEINFDALSGRCVTKRTVTYKQVTKSFQYSIRFYSPKEIIQLFKQIGFSDIVFYEDWSGNLIKQESKKMIVVARK